jgi:hypothetical protein
VARQARTARPQTALKLPGHHAVPGQRPQEPPIRSCHAPTPNALSAASRAVTTTQSHTAIAPTGSSPCELRNQTRLRATISAQQGSWAQ